MQSRFSPRFVTLAFAPLLLSLCLGRVQAQQTDFAMDGLEDVQTLTRSLTYLGKQESRPAQIGVEILPLDTQQLLNQLDETRPDEANGARVKDILARLRKMQSVFTISGRLDEAFVVRERIEEFLAGRAGVEPAPANLTAYRNQVGKTHTFRVTGRLTGSVWGNQPYTDDSDLGTAAVHAGLLHEGQRGIIKVTIRPGYEAYAGSESNGVVSGEYGVWQGSYHVSAFRLPARKGLPSPKRL